MKNVAYLKKGMNPKGARQPQNRAVSAAATETPHPAEEANDALDSPLPTRGEHCLNVYVSYDIKNRLKLLAEKYDRTTADMMRAVLRVGIPMMEGLSAAEEIMVREYIELFRKLRQVKTLKEV
jgi:predicted DNA-binding protein